VAIMLRQGSTYTDICQTTGVSTATICRSTALWEYGADGYKLLWNGCKAAVISNLPDRLERIPDE
jgi:TrpR-related protein YerC/YecD